jgi:hypothetical protein
MSTIAAWFSARPALRFVIWIGVLSLLADVTDEGGRSIAGSYLAVLGATGTVVGLIAGMGELAGYGSRLLSGVLSDRLQRLWLFMWIGYFVNLVAIPLLALAGRWEIAAALLIMVSSAWFTGTAWMLGSVLLGWLYDRSVPVIAGVSAGLQIGAIGVLALEQTVEDFNLR